MTELEQYEKSVKECVEKGNDYLFHNEGNGHALIICKYLFKNAQKEVLIAANQLYNDEVVNTREYIESMKSFLDKGNTRLNIIIASLPPKEQVSQNHESFYWMLYNHPSYKESRVQIKEGQGKFFRGTDGKEINFCTGDHNMYRFETDINLRRAVANFNDPKINGYLRDSYHKIFDTLDSNVNLNDFFA
ncbi:hypothetical protein [Odoribacter lunatus]|uniref:hypothetical protein n=1 Tax=Odoribacter lunatus TaxID=2941335 RepID=UPI00204120F6|nr:hypothetical protein [Odoribacter lunatus]